MVYVKIYDSEMQLCGVAAFEQSDIKALIPEGTTVLNPLVNMGFVTTAIATSTATFRGTYETLAELQAVTDADENDYGYVEDVDEYGNMFYKRYKFDGEEWEYEFSLSNTQFNQSQWRAINSGVTSGDITKLSTLPTSSELTALLNDKQDVIGDLQTIRDHAANAAPQATTYTKTEVNNLITTPNQEYVSVIATSQTTSVTDVLPATGAADTTYRVGNWDGTQYNDSVFSEYAWNGSAYIKLSTKSQIGEVYDISANHADAKYADLAAALGTNGANIPDTLRKGGMSVKYVCSSDNKYVQFRLMADDWSITETDWQGVDDEPTAGSDNLVKSGGVVIFSDKQKIFLNDQDNGIDVNKVVKELFVKNVDISGVHNIRFYNGSSSLYGVELFGNSISGSEEVILITTTSKSKSIVTDGSTYGALIDWNALETYCNGATYKDVRDISVNNPLLWSDINFSPSIKSELSGIEDIEELKDEVAELRDDVDGLNEDIETVESEISNIKEAVGDGGNTYLQSWVCNGRFKIKGNTFLAELKAESGNPTLYKFTKNLFVIEDQTINGVTITHNSEGKLVLNGTSTQAFNITKEFPIALAGQWYGYIKGPSVKQIALQTRIVGGGSASQATLFNSTEASFDDNLSNIKFYRLYIGSGESFDNYVLEVSLEWLYTDTHAANPYYWEAPTPFEVATLPIISDIDYFISPAETTQYLFDGKFVSGHKVVRVNKNGGGDYSSILEALKSTPDYVKIYVENGTYNIVDEYKAFYGNDYWDNYTETVYRNTKDPFGIGLCVTENREIEFQPWATVVWDYDGNNQAVWGYFSVFNTGVNATIKNLHVIFNNHCRYAIHDDWAAFGGVNKFLGCIFDGTSSNGTTIGGGCGHRNTYIIKDCLFLNDGTTDISYHNNSGNGINQIIVTGCHGNGQCKFGWYGSSQLISECIASNNKFGSIVCEAHTQDSVNENMHLTAWNNVTQ